MCQDLDLLIRDNCLKYLVGLALASFGISAVFFYLEYRYALDVKPTGLESQAGQLSEYAGLGFFGSGVALLLIMALCWLRGRCLYDHDFS